MKRKAIKLSAFSLFRCGRIGHLSIFPPKSFMRNVCTLERIEIISGIDNRI